MRSRRRSPITGSNARADRAARPAARAIGTSLFAATLVVSVATMIGIVSDVAVRRGHMATGSTLISAGFPALGTAVFGIRFQADFGGDALPLAWRPRNTLERIDDELRRDVGLSRAADLTEQAARVDALRPRRMAAGQPAARARRFGLVVLCPERQRQPPRVVLAQMIMNTNERGNEDRQEPPRHGRQGNTRLAKMSGGNRPTGQGPALPGDRQAGPVAERLCARTIRDRRSCRFSLGGRPRLRATGRLQLDPALLQRLAQQAFDLRIGRCAVRPPRAARPPPTRPGRSAAERPCARRARSIGRACRC